MIHSPQKNSPMARLYSRTYVILALAFGIFSSNLFQHGPEVLAFTSPKTIVTAYGVYDLYGTLVDKPTAETLCTATGFPLATFTSNVAFQALVAAIAGDAEVAGGQYWVDPTLVSTTPYFGSESVSGSSWYTGEPDYTCTNPCCFRIKPTSGSYIIGLADIDCTGPSFYYICLSQIVTTTTVAPTTTTASPTTTTASPTTTTVPPTTTTVAPTTTTASPTTTTVPPTTTTMAPTTTSASPTTTTAAPTTTTASPTTTTASPTTTTASPTTTTAAPATTTASSTTTTASPTTTTAAPTTTTSPTTTTASPTTTTAAPTTTTAPATTTSLPASTTTTTAGVTTPAASPCGENSVSWTTGEQMMFLYLGIVLSGSLGLASLCTVFWVGINRKRGHVREYPEQQDTDASDLSDCSASETEVAGEEGYEEESNKKENDDDDNVVVDVTSTSFSMATGCGFLMDKK